MRHHASTSYVPLKRRRCCPRRRARGRLSSEWLVNQFLRWQESRLSYERYVTNRRLRTSRATASTHTNGAGRVVLTAGISGSAAHKRRLQADALHIYQRLGRPTFFVTLPAHGWHYRNGTVIDRTYLCGQDIAPAKLKRTRPARTCPGHYTALKCEGH